jgi:hypothetical protein
VTTGIDEAVVLKRAKELAWNAGYVWEVEFATRSRYAISEEQQRQFLSCARAKLVREAIDA